MLLQTLEKIKMKYKNSTITLLTDSSNIDIIPLTNNLINDIIPINRKVFKDKKIFKSLVEIYKVFISIRKKFDMCIDFQCFGETATISYLTNAKIKLGAPKRAKYNYGYTNFIKRDDYNHRSQLFSRIAQVDDSLDFSTLVLNEEATNYCEFVLNKLNINKQTIGLNIGSTQENRRWNDKNFSKLANLLTNDYNVIVFLGPSEQKYKSSFDDDILFIEKVNLIELCGAINTCNYFISNDTGPVHMAAALKIPTLTLFSTGDDDNVGALIDRKTYLKNTCIDKISVTNVMSKLNLIMSPPN